jgi:hypothetical protein
MEQRMQTDTQAAPASKAMLRAGYIASAVPVLLLLFSGAMKLSKSPDVVKGFTDLGWPESLALALGIVEITCTVIYAIPRTSVLGAILLTGYMGGAIATHVRIGELFIVQAALGVLVWLGLYLRDARVRSLIPLRK